MTTELAVRKTVLDLMIEQRMSCSELAARADVHENVIRRAIAENPLKTHITSASAIAAALSVTVEDIRWINGLSTMGRAAHSGSPILNPNRPSHATTCPVHFTLLPSSGVCDDCTA